MKKYDFSNIMEQLADIEHQRWADWQTYLHSKLGYSEYKKGGKNFAIYVLDAGDYVRWEEQIDKGYEELSEQEKESDREQVRRYLPIIEKEILKAIKETKKAPKKTKKVIKKVAKTPAWNKYMMIDGSFDYKDYILQELVKSKRKDLVIIGKYFAIKNMNFPTYKALSSSITRFLKDAVIIKDYPDEQIERAFEYVVEKFPTDWKLSTVNKYIGDEEINK